MEKCTKENLEMAATTIRGLIGYHKRMTMNECAVCEECDTHKAIGGCPTRVFEDVYLQALEISLELIEERVRSLG